MYVTVIERQIVTFLRHSVELLHFNQSDISMLEIT